LAAKKKAGSGALLVGSRLALIGLIAIVLIVGGISVWWLWPSQPDREAELPAPTEEPTATAEATPGTDEPAEPPMATAEPAPGTDEPAEPPMATAEPAPGTDEPAEPPTATAEPAPGTDEPAEPPTTTAALTPGTGEATEPPEPAFEPPAETEEATAPPKALDCPPDADAAPGCALAERVLSTLETAGAPPRVTLNRPGGIYLDREFLVVETELPAEAGGYLYLDVLTDAGEVYHLLPEPMRQDNELPAGGEIRVGVEQAERRDGVRHWQIGEPFGKGYVLALVSEKPLYDELRPVEESIADYRDVLLKALADQGTGRKSAQITPIEFRPRG
jgi:eukaryotic-like serine/threonine-protein kinase